MNCQNCEAPVLASEERCQRCGAKLLHRRLFPGTARPEEFVLTSEEDITERDDPAESEHWQFPPHREFEPLSGSVAEASEPEVRWGGFFRRACALVIDVAIILLLSTVMGDLAYVGFKVGLAAHDRLVTRENAPGLFFLLGWGWWGLAAGYFVVFHGMEGKTIGKWLLGLRVVGAKREVITYRRAFLRWLGVVGFAPIGLGFLWVLWSPEKRGWHDYLARTWVIRD
jgi:uncharacterized RDD family membrane protein YckC